MRMKGGPKVKKSENEVKRPRGRPRKEGNIAKIKGVRLPKSLETELKVYCLRREITASQAIRKAIEQLISQNEKEK